ncbi:MAG TPA: HAMP domain-containing sensor histidine kinase, partial [Candidatus Saccharimonadia bacterium]|nr:HAMP domain-containing sensor histidine kinase [Candidatus Saccharimonadia bacterium]
KSDASTSEQKESYSVSSSSGSLSKKEAVKGKPSEPVKAYDEKSAVASAGQKRQREDAQAKAVPPSGPMPSQQQESVQADLDARSRPELKGALSKANQTGFPVDRPSTPITNLPPSSEMNLAVGNLSTSSVPPATPVPAAPPAPITLASAPSLPPVATAKPLQGFWIEDALLLTREASLDGARVLQGVWLDWPKLREQWLAQVRDLFPQAALEPAPNALPGETVQDDPLRLASLPVRLVTGPFAVAPVPFWTPMRSSLAVAWLCMGLAAVAVGAVLFGTVSLSERRAAFVSAVTHELRTPLTTFRLYSEMLASGMVQDEEQKKNYLGTLEAEAGRLSHLVENVLAYARIERGSARAQVESVSIGEVLDRVLPRLQQRAEQAGMEVAVDANEEERKVLLRVDVSALEQILFNLVDNACKYAAPRAADKTIHVQASTKGPLAMLRVRDHGAGIAPQERRRVFRPFHKSADKAAHSAPGVGLGLALCERLSRALGGRLSLEKGPAGAGASFVLELPRVGS